MANASRTVFVNGAFVPEHEATVSVFDRGFLMADAIYEVTTVLDGKLIDFDWHFERLTRSLNELGIRQTVDRAQLLDIHRKIVKLNGLEEGMIYLQISRGVCDRDFLIENTPEPSIVLFTQVQNFRTDPVAERGMRVISTQDIRWKRRDIKTVQLLGASLAKTAAKKANADDAWLVEDGYVTEGTSNNAYILKDGKIITRNLSTDLLHGITRRAVLGYAQSAGYAVEERAFTLEEVYSAEEAFVTSATAFVRPVVHIDGRDIGDGKPGPVARHLREIYMTESLKTAQ